MRSRRRGFESTFSILSSPISTHSVSMAGFTRIFSDFTAAFPSAFHLPSTISSRAMKSECMPCLIAGEVRGGFGAGSSSRRRTRKPASSRAARRSLPAHSLRTRSSQASSLFRCAGAVLNQVAFPAFDPHSRQPSRNRNRNGCYSVYCWHCQHQLCGDITRIFVGERVARKRELQYSLDLSLVQHHHRPNGFVRNHNDKHCKCQRCVPSFKYWQYLRF